MIKEIGGKKPDIHESCFIAENATVLGNVVLGENASVWYGAVIRSDSNTTVIGANSNIQDNCTVHNSPGFSVSIGRNVTVGHNSIVHGCTIDDNVLIGMGSIILNGAHIGKNTIIGAGSLVTQHKDIPDGVLCMGSPAKVVRQLTEEEIKSLKKSADHYVELSRLHK